MGFWRYFRFRIFDVFKKLKYKIFLVGQLINNNGKMVRDIKHMPRNSIALVGF